MNGSAAPSARIIVQAARRSGHQEIIRIRIFIIKDKGMSFTLRVILGIAGLGIAVVVINQSAGFIVPLLLAWIVVLSASPHFYWLRTKNPPC